MVVHVDEMHTDVRPPDETDRATPPASTGSTSGVTLDELWRESRGRTEWLDRRTAAEGFDD